MPYLVIDDFNIGLDLRKGPVTAPAASLRVLKNAVINSGAEIEKRKAFVHHASVPGTIGLAGAVDEFVVFKQGASPGNREYVTPYLSNYIFQDRTGITPTVLYAAQYWQGGYFFNLGDAADNRYSYYAGQALDVSQVKGNQAKVFGTKVYVSDGRVLRFSDVNDPSGWDATVLPNEGAGFIDVSTADSFGTNILGIERYYENLAVFGVSTIQVWSTDTDPKLNSIVQTIGGTGLYSRGAHAAFSSGDVLFLSQTGLRSLKARDASNFAVTTDLGSPIDPLIKQIIPTLTASEVQKNICCAIEPKTGSFWLALKNRILVLSFYPAAKVSAWSEFSVPFNIDYMVANDQAIAIRSGNDIYIYGGNYNQDTYDTAEATVVTPFLDATQPATRKMFNSLDVACEGQWSVRYNVNPLVDGAWSQTATINGPTFSLDTIPMGAMGTHIQFELKTTSASRATLNSLVCHFEGKGAS